MADTFPADIAAKWDLDDLAVATLRTLSIDGVQKANSGHPGMPLGSAPMAHVLWSRHLKFDSHRPDWADRDRFVLSAGHGSMLLYSLLHLAGYGLGIEELEAFRQWGSRTPGHPEVHHCLGWKSPPDRSAPGSPTAWAWPSPKRSWPPRSTGRASIWWTTTSTPSCGDGDLMEGVASEAASLAGHLGLGKLVYLYDDNQISIEGCTDLAFTEDVGARFEAYGWQVIRVDDGNDLEAIDAAIGAARAEKSRPSLIMVRTVIGCGSPHKAGSAEAHGSPLGVDEVKLTKEALGWPGDLLLRGARPRARAVRGRGCRRGICARPLGRARSPGTRRSIPSLPEQWKARMARQAARGLRRQAARLRRRREHRHPVCIGQGPQRPRARCCPR